MATEGTLGRILKMTRGKNAAYMWSGGKDSLVVADLCKRADITKCYCLLTELEYPEWVKFLLESKPPNCEMINVGYDTEFISEHSELLFAAGKLEQFWNRNIRQKYFQQCIREKGIEVLVLGHRTIDGNVCGKDGIRKPRYGGILYSPIYDWSHELLFAFLHYNSIELPFIYKWYRVFFEGTHLWVERENYQQVYNIDPSVVLEAAKKIPSAKKFLEEMK